MLSARIRQHRGEGAIANHPVLCEDQLLGSSILSGEIPCTRARWLWRDILLRQALRGATRCFGSRITPDSRRFNVNDMVEDGYQEIVNTDLSSMGIDNFKARYAHVPQLSYVAIDSRDMSAFQDCSFDVVIGKGLADSMLFLIYNHSHCRSHPEIRIPALLEPGLKWSILVYALAKPATEKAVMETIKGLTPDSLPIDERNWSLGLEDFGGDKGMTLFTYAQNLMK